MQRQACRVGGIWLHIEDTTTLSFNERKDVEGLGWTGHKEGRSKGKGIFLHTALNARIESWTENQNPQVTLQGLVSQEWWVRTEPSKHGKESKKEAFERPRESERWGRWYGLCDGPSPDAQWIYVADRESDSYEIFERCTANGIDFVIRARTDRALSENARHLFAAVKEAPCLGAYTHTLRTRGKDKSRVATLEVRAINTSIKGPWRPGGWLPPFPLHVVEVQEVNAPEGVEPIQWVLLTDMCPSDFTAAHRIAQIYACRWLIEEYHKALKTGVGIEKTQLRNAGSITALLGILALVAVRLLNMKFLARTHPDTIVPTATLEPEMLDVLTAKFGKPEGGWTYASALTGVAKIGGFLARKGDGYPGWLTIWRGWNKLVILAEGLLLARALEKCG